jgi:hypothetical protein
MIARHGETHNQVVAVVLRFGTQERLTYALLDSGSSVSMIRTDLARELGMSGPPSTMTIAWTDSIGKSIKTEQLIGEIRDFDSLSETRIVLFTNKELQLPRHCVTQATLIAEGLDDLPVSCEEEVIPQLLIGQDNMRLIEPLEVRKGSSPDLYIFISHFRQ